MVDISKMRPSENFEDRTKRKAPTDLEQRLAIRAGIARTEIRTGTIPDDDKERVEMWADRADGTVKDEDPNYTERTTRPVAGMDDYESTSKPDPNISREMYPGNKNRHLRRSKRPAGAPSDNLRAVANRER